MIWPTTNDPRGQNQGWPTWCPPHLSSDRLMHIPSSALYRPPHRFNPGPPPPTCLLVFLYVKETCAISWGKTSWSKPTHYSKYCIKHEPIITWCEKEIKSLIIITKGPPPPGDPPPPQRSALSQSVTLTGVTVSGGVLCQKCQLMDEIILLSV